MVILVEYNLRNDLASTFAFVIRDELDRTSPWRRQRIVESKIGFAAGRVTEAMEHVRFEDAVPSWLIIEVLEPVLADLQGDRPIALDVTHDPDGYVVVHEREERAGTGLRVPSPGVQLAELRVAWADHLQDQFFPETRAAWGEPRPPCPGHPHPATATRLEGEAWWVCPTDASRIRRIGELFG